MCVYSMIVDARFDDWQRRYPPFSPTPMPTQQEIDEFRRLLEKAREYDRANSVRTADDCETEEKRQRILELAKKLGINIEFV